MPLAFLRLLPVVSFQVPPVQFQTPAERRKAYNKWRRQWRKKRAAEGKRYL